MAKNKRKEAAVPAKKARPRASSSAKAASRAPTNPSAAATWQREIAQVLSAEIKTVEEAIELIAEYVVARLGSKRHRAEEREFVRTMLLSDEALCTQLRETLRLRSK